MQLSASTYDKDLPVSCSTRKIAQTSYTRQGRIEFGSLHIEVSQKIVYIKKTNEYVTHFYKDKRKPK